MSLADLFGSGEETSAPVGPEKPGKPVRQRGWLASAQVAPVAVVAAIAMALPVLAYYGRIPVTVTLGDAGPLVAWIAVAAGWGLGLVGAGAGLAAAISARRFGWVAVIALVSLALGGLAMSQHADQAVSAQAYYKLHTDAFGKIRAVAVADRARAAAATRDPATTAGDESAAVTEIRLPKDLREHSVTGQLAALGDGSYFMPVDPGLGDGFLFAPDSPPPDSGGDLTELGGGWYWLANAG